MYKLNKHTSTTKEKGIAHPGRSFKSSQKAGGTPGTKNPSSTVRGRTMKSGKGVVPAKAKTPTRVNQPNPKGKRSVKSNPVGYKNAMMRFLKGGTAFPSAAKVRGGMGATRPNFGQTTRTTGLRAIGGRGK